MKKAILRHDDVKGFVLDDENGNFIMTVDAGSKEEEVDWELIEQQANEKDYTLED